MEVRHNACPVTQFRDLLPGTVFTSVINPATPVAVYMKTYTHGNYDTDSTAVDLATGQVQWIQPDLSVIQYPRAKVLTSGIPQSKLDDASRRF